ncbi:PDF receptor [Trichonephila clavata]|uniref:PDF receptor n=1 Tax=Trichonephila clavata TaxID=2740835 RepID=A0A8X6G605_TRICU|nr:PDF receptor [Trichonephila clavata]
MAVQERPHSADVLWHGQHQLDVRGGAPPSQQGHGPHLQAGRPLQTLLLHRMGRVIVFYFHKNSSNSFQSPGIPAVCIGSWCSLMYLYHNTPCWSGYGDLPYIWVITGPMLGALLVNSVFLVDIIRVLVTKRHANFGGDANQVRCALYDGLPQQKYCPWPHAQPSINACGRKKAIKATALLFPLLGIPHLLFCINPKDNGKLEEAYMIVNAFIKSSQVK